MKLLEVEPGKTALNFITCPRARCMGVPQVLGLARDVRDGWTCGHPPDMEALFLSLDLRRALIRTSVGKTATVSQKHPQRWSCVLLLGHAR